MHNQIASFRAALDARPVSRYQWLILLLLALLLVTDGYDAQVLGYVVPALAQDWGCLLYTSDAADDNTAV